LLQGTWERPSDGGKDRGIAPLKHITLIGEKNGKKAI